MSQSTSNRRSFLHRTALVASFPLVSRLPVWGANGRLNIAGIGVGGKGEVDVARCDSENIAAWCDVDDVRAAGTFQKYPKAKRFRDFRVMLDQLGNGGPPAISDFSAAGPMTEIVLLGNVAVRAGRPITWDRAAMRVVNDSAANQFVRQPNRPGWTI